MIWLIALALMLACVPTVATSFPTLDPGAVNTFIVQTANAASSGTARVISSLSPVATETPTPRNTASPPPTSTVTFVFILPGSTSSLSAPTLAGIVSGTSNSNYGCRVFSTEPANGTEFAPRTDFVATWGVKNIGIKEWFRATMKYVYVSGDKLHKVTSYSIPKGAETGKNVILTVDMEALKNAGKYTTTWSLVADNTYFCPLTLTIVVK
jgi:hypothetical protein